VAATVGQDRPCSGAECPTRRAVEELYAVQSVNVGWQEGLGPTVKYDCRLKIIFTLRGIHNNNHIILGGGKGGDEGGAGNETHPSAFLQEEANGTRSPCPSTSTGVREVLRHRPQIGKFRQQQLLKIHLEKPESLN